MISPSLLLATLLVGVRTEGPMIVRRALHGGTTLHKCYVSPHCPKYDPKIFEIMRKDVAQEYKSLLDQAKQIYENELQDWNLHGNRSESLKCNIKSKFEQSKQLLKRQYDDKMDQIDQLETIALQHIHHDSANNTAWQSQQVEEHAAADAASYKEIHQDQFFKWQSKQVNEAAQAVDKQKNSIPTFNNFTGC